MKNQNVIVIGGGIAGLTAANFLARAGKSVTLYEKSHTVGGRAMTEEKNGFRFNLGPHALYAAGAGVKILKELGIEFHGAKPATSGGYAIYRGRKQTLPSGAVSLMTTGLFGLAAKMETARLLATIGSVDAQAVNDLTVNEWLEKEIRQPEVRALVSALFRVSTYANEPDQQSAGASIAQVQMALSSGVYYLDGGWQTLVDGLRKTAENSGVKFCTGEKVIALEIDQKVNGVQLTDHSRKDAAAIILASSPENVLDLLPKNRGENLRQWNRGAIPIRAACLDVALKSLPQPRATFALGIDCPYYFSVHSATARLAPEEGAMIHVAKYLSSQEKNSAREIEQELESVLDLIQPGWRDVLIEHRYLPRLTVTSAVLRAEEKGYAGRPQSAIQNIDGLFIAGDWVGDEGMLADASFASAKKSAEIALNYLERL